MEKIVVDKQELLKVLKENRERHHSIFLEAQDGYRTAVIGQLDSMLQDARNGKKIRRSVTLIEPMDQTKDYDRVIRMMEMAVDTQIDLNEYDFRCYVLDEWDWKKQFGHSNRSYSRTLMAMPEE